MIKMPNVPPNLPIPIILLIAGSNKDVDRNLETLTAIARTTQEAIRSIRCYDGHDSSRRRDIMESYLAALNNPGARPGITWCAYPPR